MLVRIWSCGDVPFPPLPLLSPVRYAKETVGQDQYFEMAMGGGQQPKAEALLKQCSEGGTWLCIKNLHLVVAWLPTLEKMLNSMRPSKNFRLWLTTEAHSKFPTILIQQSLKITFESPPGVKKNMQRTHVTAIDVLEGGGETVERLTSETFVEGLLRERGGAGNCVRFLCVVRRLCFSPDPPGTTRGRPSSSRRAAPAARSCCSFWRGSTHWRRSGATSSRRGGRSSTSSRSATCAPRPTWCAC